MWKKISTKVILDHKRLKVFEDEVELPSGKKSDYIYFESKGCVSSVVCQQNDKYLIQTEYSYVPNINMYQFPGGFVPFHENPKDGAKRELIEETGLYPQDLTLLGSCFINHRRSTSKLYVFLATGFKEAKQKLDDSEDSLQNRWLSFQEIEDLIKTNDNLSENFITIWQLYKSRKNE